MSIQEKLTQSKQLYETITNKLNEIESTLIKLNTEKQILEKQEKELLHELKQDYNINTIEEATERIKEIEQDLERDIAQYNSILSKLNGINLNESTDNA